MTHEMFIFFSYDPSNERFEVLTVVLLQIQVFWDAMLCCSVRRSWHIKGPQCLYLQGQAVWISGSIAWSWRNTKCHEPFTPPHSITSHKSWILIQETNTKECIWHEMCVAIVVQLLSETSFLLMNIYSYMQVTLEMYEEKLFCPVFTKIWIAWYFLSKSYVRF